MHKLVYLFVILTHSCSLSNCRYEFMYMQLYIHWYDLKMQYLDETNEVSVYFVFILSRRIPGDELPVGLSCNGVLTYPRQAVTGALIPKGSDSGIRVLGFNPSFTSYQLLDFGQVTQLT